MTLDSRAWIVGAVVLATSIAVACGEDRKYGDATSAAGGSSAGSAGSAGSAMLSGGSGNEAGESSAGGSGGEGGNDDPEPVACQDDTDCDDGTACNGVETCEGGFCQDGTPFCADQEEEGCTVTCAEPDDSDDDPTCTKEVTDADGDGHVAEDNTCSADTDKPKDDCDDDEPATYLDAEEICDGKDNDCDGLDDFAEGTALGGQARTLWTASAEESSGSYSATAWCDALDHYVVVWPTSLRVRAARLTPGGEMAGPSLTLVDDGKSHSGRVLVGCSGDVVGVVWATGADALRFARFRLSTTSDEVEQLDPVPLSLPLIDGDYKAWGVARAGQDAWAVFGNNADAEGIIYRITDAGAIVPPPHNLGPASWENSIAGSGDEVAAFWSRSESDPVGVTKNWARYGGANMTEILAPQTLVEKIPSTSDGTTAISGISGGFFMIARTRSQRVLVTKRTFSGDGECGPIEITDSPQPLAGDGEIRLATANDTSAFYMASSNASVFRLPVDCNQAAIAAGERLLPLIDESYNSAAGMSVRSSPQGHLVVWHSGFNLRARAFGNAFCDTPE